jgi:hypothetical protein
MRKTGYPALAVLCCMLFLVNFNTAAQNQTFPLPAPGEGASTLPAPVQGTGKPALAEAPAREPVKTPPAQSGEAAKDSETAKEGAPRAARRPPAGERPATGQGQQAPEQQAPEQQAPAASSQTGIPSKGMFVGGMSGGVAYFYDNKDKDKVNGYGSFHDGGGFNGGLLFGYDFGLLAGQAEILINGEYGGFHGSSATWNGWWNKDYVYSRTSIQIPIMLKLDLHWRRIMFQPQAGFYLNLSPGDLEFKQNQDYYYANAPEEFIMDYSSPLFGFMAGLALGVRIGRGYLFLDSRYMVEMGDSHGTFGNGYKSTWNRFGGMWNLGYQYYFKGKQ